MVPCPRLGRYARVLTTLAAACLCVASAHAQQVALTFDDLPAHGPLPAGVTRQQVITDILDALKASGTPPVYGFINGVRQQENPSDASVLDLWRRFGYPLGNHTWSHMNLNDHTAAEWEADLLKNEQTLAPLMNNADWHWVRFPYLSEGNTPEKTAEVRTFLAAHDYRIAGVTMSFGDYLFNEPYARCLARSDSAAVTQLEDLFLEASKNDLLDRRAMAHAAFGHDIPYVLLMHVGAFDAHMLPRLLALYRQQGVSFVSLQQAESDLFYRNDLDPRMPPFPDSLEAAVAAKRVSPPHHGTPLDALDKLCR